MYCPGGPTLPRGRPNERYGTSRTYPTGLPWPSLATVAPVSSPGTGGTEQDLSKPAGDQNHGGHDRPKGVRPRRSFSDRSIEMTRHNRPEDRTRPTEGPNEIHPAAALSVPVLQLNVLEALRWHARNLGTVSGRGRVCRADKIEGVPGLKYALPLPLPFYVSPPSPSDNCVPRGELQWLRGRIRGRSTRSACGFLSFVRQW